MAESKVTKSSKPAAVKKVVAKTATPTATKATITTTSTKKANTTTKKPVAVAEPVEIFEEVKKMAPIQPPHSIKINFFKKSIVAKITLHKIPDKCINLHPTPTRFHLDTLKYSKKFVLDIPYPENVIVDDEKATCTFEHDILTVFIPITSKLPEREIKTNNKKDNKKSTQDKESAPVLVKRKQSEPTTTEKPKKQQPQKKQKVDTTPVEVAAPIDEQIEDQEEETHKKKKFIENDSAIEIMNQISKEQEQKAIQKIKDEKKKTQQQESKVVVKQVKKASAIEKKENILKKLKGDETVVEQVEEKQPTAKPTTVAKGKKLTTVSTPTKKSPTPTPAPVEEEGTPSKKSVSFGEKVKVNVRNIPKVGKGHKLN